MEAWSIASVERDTGLSKELLRMWERRYGFPQPLRDAQGDRLYPADQVERLRLLKRLMDGGHRPGKLLALAPAELQDLAQQSSASEAPPAPTQEMVAQLLDILSADDVAGLRQFLARTFADRGLRTFVLDVAVPSLQAVGQAWFEGRLAVHQEHLFSEELQKMLRQNMYQLPATPRAPRLLLTTLPNELHGLGLLMAEAMLRTEEADVCSFGLQMPIPEIAAAAVSHGAQVVALSFSASFPPVTLRQALHELDRVLPDGVEVWAGGAGVRGMRKLPERVHRLESLADLLTSLKRWRRSR